MRGLFGRILILAVSAVLPCAALADSTGASGTYNYNISLPNGASFTLTQSAALGVVGSSSTGWSYNGTPMDGYVPPGDGSIYFTGDNSTWTELQIQWMLPDATNPNTADSVDSFTFAEPDTFWSTPGVYSMFPADGTTTYNGIQLVTENIDGSNGNPVFGTVNQGAFYNVYSTPGGVYTPPGTDPPCCSITTTFTPAVASTPEPSTITLLGTGMVALIGVSRRRRLS